jgi:protein-S-isoprenylcysteine O-methyltransferase Ste14
MALNRRRTAGMVLYAALFCLVLPMLLILWARATVQVVPLAPVGFPLLAFSLIGIGMVLVFSGMAALWRQGGGLPMNAFPPPRFVATGIYAVLPHPIYVGFFFLVLGASMYWESASGIWLVSPAVAFGCAALVLGYERIDLQRRFGMEGARACPCLPADEMAAPDLGERLRCVVLVLLPWAGLYLAVSSLGVPKDGLDLGLSFERRIPILAWTEWVYVTPYFFAVCAPFFARSKHDLRMFSIRSWIATAFIFPIYVALPVLAPRPPLVPDNLAGALLAWERGTYPPVAAFPSFHVIWAAITASLFAARSPRIRWLWCLWALGVAASCLTTRMHTVADIVSGGIVSLGLIRVDWVWRRLRGGAERIANSWREWRVGPVRIINHGAYAGIATLLGLSIAGSAAGPSNLGALAVAAAAGLVGAALWAQWIEGSPRLLRPYGFYGGATGVALGSLLARLQHKDPWLIFAAFCLAMPCIQGIGRLRCLVQGCCHGHPTSEALGIRYLHPRSRVCTLAALPGIPVHPTPLYSILWNGFIFLLVSRLWFAGASLSMIIGASMLLSGFGRFVEEAYRGEPQTPIYAGLRLYQWVAIATVILGAVVTAVGSAGPAPAPQWGWNTLTMAAAFGAFNAIALGVDFPGSNRRFARLA